MNKIFALLIVLALVLMLFGCTEQINEVNEQEDSTTDDVQIDSTVSEEIDYSIVSEDETIDVGEMI